jgi:HemY protein
MRAIRVAASLVVIVVLVAVAVFFADHPGRVAIAWQGWQVETSVGVLAAAAVLLALAVAALLRLVRLIGRSPRAVSRWRRERRRRAGYRALSQGMVAVAAGEPREAQRHARRADALLADPPLTLLLSAQAAQLDGDENAAEKFFMAMLDRPETEFLGLRGLINQALRAGERGTALALAERARRLRPNTRWVTQSLFDLEIREGRWQAALDTLAEMVKKHLIPADRGRRHRGVILYELSRAAIADGEGRRATKLAAEAQRLTPDLAAPAAHHARLLVEAGQAGPAAKAVERAWRTAPNPELAQVYDTIHRAAPPLAKLKRFERLAAQNPGARESHLALAEAALAAQLWGEARRRLEQALNAEPTPPAAADAAATPRLCLMMARLEEVEHHDFVRVREWLDRAVAAPPDPRHVCSHCGGESRQWRSRCPHCGHFDTLVWRTPASSGVGAALPAMPQRAAAPAAELPAASAAAE